MFISVATIGVKYISDINYNSVRLTKVKSWLWLSVSVEWLVIFKNLQLSGTVNKQWTEFPDILGDFIKSQKGVSISYKLPEFGLKYF